jgi:hypothetical protein
MQKSDARCAVWVVLNVSDLRWNAILIVTNKIDETVCTLVTATLVTNSYATLVVTSTL